MSLRIFAVVGLCLAATAASAADDAAGLLKRARDMTGGALWDKVTALHGDGEMHAAGLNGTVVTHEDLLRGRSVTRYTLGALVGAWGYDGKVGWEQDPGGEVSALDDAQAQREARTAAWLTARAYWYPQRGGATYGAVEKRAIRGRNFHVVTATPTDGEPVTLWFADNSGLLEQLVTRVGGKDMQTTRVNQWKVIDGLRLPFATIVDRNGDERSHVYTHYYRYAPGMPSAEREFAVPAVSERTHIDDPSGRARVPFTLVRDHIHVSATLDGKPLRMLVDTGGVNILSPAAIKRLGLAVEGHLQGRGVGEKSTDVGIAKAAQLQLGGLRIDQPVFYMMDLGQLADVEGEDFDGVIGYELFQRFGVTIDYGAKEMLLAPLDKFAPPPNAQALPFTLAERIPIVQGKIDGVPARFSVDTGSGSALDLHAPFVKRNNLVARTGARYQAITGWGVGGPVRSWPVRLGQVQLGDATLADVDASLFTGELGAFAGDDVDANLGGRILQRFVVAFDYRKKQMYLAPTARLAVPFEHDRSGLSLLRDGDALKVFDALENGPAAAAGLAAGDRILAIDGEATTKRPLNAWREFLSTSAAGKSVAIRYERGGKKASAKIVLKDLIPPQAMPAAP